MLNDPFKVLIVDDSKAICAILKKQLPPEKFNVVAEALDGNSALVCFRKHRPDIVILDIVLPQLSGVAIYKEINKISPEAQVVLITDKATPDLIKKLMSYNAKYFLVKPIKREVLLYTMQKAMAVSAIEIISENAEIDFSSLVSGTKQIQENFLYLMDRKELIDKAFFRFDEKQKEVVPELEGISGEIEKIESRFKKTDERKKSIFETIDNLRFIIENLSKNNEMFEYERRSNIEKIKQFMEEKTVLENVINEILSRYKSQEENLRYAKINLQKIKARLLEKLQRRETIVPEMKKAKQELDILVMKSEESLENLKNLKAKAQGAEELRGKIIDQLRKIDHELEQSGERHGRVSTQLREMRKHSTKMKSVIEKAEKEVGTIEGRIEEFLAKMPGNFDRLAAKQQFDSLEHLVDLPDGTLPKRNALLNRLVDARTIFQQQTTTYTAFEQRMLAFEQEYSKFERTKTHYLEMKSKFKAKLDEIAIFLKDTAENMKVLDGVFKDTSAQKEIAKSTFIRLQQNFAPLKGEIERLNDEAELAESSVRTFLIKKEQLEKELSAKDKDYNKEEEKITTMTEVNTRISENIKKHNQEIEKAKSDISQKNEELTKLDAEIEHLKKELDEIKHRRSTLLVRISKFEEARIYFGEIRGKIDRILKEKYCRDIVVMATDIRGSTKYFETFGDFAGRKMIKIHNELLMPLISKCGRIFKTKGDAIFAYFDNPDEAISISKAMQNALVEYNSQSDSQEHQIHIRIFLHFGMGIIEEKKEGFEVYGDAVYTTMKIEECSGDHADTIVVSTAMFDQIIDNDEYLFDEYTGHTYAGEPGNSSLYEFLWKEM